MNPDKIRIPVIFHNLRGYDSHLIMQQIGTIAKDKSYVNKNGERTDLKINANLTTWKDTWPLHLGIT